MTTTTNDKTLKRFSFFYSDVRRSFVGGEINDDLLWGR
jgi:hypothetical protein